MGSLLRVVETVALQIVKPETGEVLVQTQQTINAETKLEDRLPYAKRRPDENHFLAARRVLDKVLRIDANYINMSPHDVRFSEKTKNSKGFPALRSQFRKHIIQAEVAAGF